MKKEKSRVWKRDDAKGWDGKVPVSRGNCWNVVVVHRKTDKQYAAAV